MLQSIRRFTVIGCASVVIGISIVGEIMPSLSQPSPESNSGTPNSERKNKPLNRNEFIRVIKQKFPNFYTFDDLSPDLKARASRQNGVIRVVISRGETATLPNGDRVESDGSLIKRNGVKFQPVMQNGKLLRHRVFKPDGTELKPGENYTAPDGMSITMPK